MTKIYRFRIEVMGLMPDGEGWSRTWETLETIDQYFKTYESACKHFKDFYDNRENFKGFHEYNTIEKFTGEDNSRTLDKGELKETTLSYDAVPCDWAEEYDLILSISEADLYD